MVLSVKAQFIWRPVSWFAMRMRWLVSAWYRFLLRCFFKRVVLILNYKLLCVKKCNCPIVYSEIPLCRDSFSCGDRSAGKQCGLIAWFLYSARYSIEGFLKNLLESFINNLCVKICNSSNTLQFFHIPLNNVSEILWKILQFIFCIFFNTLFVYFVILFPICLTKLESIKLKCYFAALLYTVAVNMLFLKLSSKNIFSFNYTFDAG